MMADDVLITIRKGRIGPGELNSGRVTRDGGRPRVLYMLHGVKTANAK